MTRVRVLAPILLVLAMLVVGCTSVLTLDVGTCFDDPDDFAEVTDVPVVECADPHDNEVIGVFDIPGDEFPGETVVNDAAERGCLDAFSTYIGVPYEDSIYDIGWFGPTEDSWSIGDREVICFAYRVDLAEITRSIRGAAE